MSEHSDAARGPGTSGARSARTEMTVRNPRREPRLRADGYPDGPRGRELLRFVRELQQNPLPGFDELHERWGDVVGLKIPTHNLVLLYHPEDIDEVIVANGRKLGKGESIRRWSRLMGDNLIVIEGEVHDRHRRMASPVFRPRDIAPQADWAVHHASQTIDGWREGRSVDVGPDMDHMVLAQMGHALFGVDILQQAAGIRHVMEELDGAFGFLLKPYYPAIAWLPLPVMRRIDRSRDYFGAVLTRFIDEAARAHAAGERRSDLTSVLMRVQQEEQQDAHPHAALTRQELLDETRGMLLAGHDTTASTLIWALYLLARNHDVRDRMLDEIDRVSSGVSGPLQYEHYEQLRYTRAVIDETLRLYPVGTAAVRQTRAPIELAGGVTLPEGVEVVAPMMSVHRDERWWPEPLEFRPERFLDPDPELPRFAYFPFGGGRRICIGQALALLVATLSLATIHERYTLELTDDDADENEPSSQINIRPTRPVRLIARSRVASGDPISV